MRHIIYISYCCYKYITKYYICRYMTPAKSTIFVVTKYYICRYMKNLNCI